MVTRRSRKSMLDTSSGRMGGTGGRLASHRRHQILRDIAEAEEDLKSAWRQMNETTDNDLIDSAIYLVKAAEIRYGVLIRMLREEQ